MNAKREKVRMRGEHCLETETKTKAGPRGRH